MFKSNTKKFGWNWSIGVDSSDGNMPTESDVIQDAWRHAGERAQGKLNIPSETSGRMGTKEQREMIEEALVGK
jgi:hypothetical protein